MIIIIIINIHQILPINTIFTPLLAKLTQVGRAFIAITIITIKKVYVYF